MLNTNRNLLFKGIILALCVISFVHVFLFPLYDIKNTTLVKKTFLEFEQSLCIVKIKHRKVWKTGRCPQYGIVTIYQGGRLANQIWEYADVWALARRTGLEPYIPRCIRLTLEQVFESLTVPTFEEIAHCPVPMGGFVGYHAWNDTSQSIILPRYLVDPELVLTWVQDIIQEFTIKRKLREKSQRILRLAAKNQPNITTTFVGVHVRRTDYIEKIRRKHSVEPAGFYFYSSAMTYFENKYSNVLFIMASDDPSWCIKMFNDKKNVFIVGRNHRNTPALDLAILASCNHSIFDYGTYGEWGAILAQGETIFFNLTGHSSQNIGRLLPNWHTI